MVEPDPAPDFDEEQYQNELNDAVDDGGGRRNGETPGGIVTSLRPIDGLFSRSRCVRSPAVGVSSLGLLLRKRSRAMKRLK